MTGNTFQTTAKLSYSLCMRGVPPSFFIMNTEKILSKCLKKLNINDKNLTANEFAESKLNILYYIMRAENKLKNFEENIFTEDLIVYYTCLLWSMNTDNIKSAYFHNLLSATAENFFKLPLHNKKNRK